MTDFRKVTATLALLTHGACGGLETTDEATPAHAQAVPSVSVNSALGEAGCAQGSANTTIDGFGEADSGLTYGSSGCARGYLVDIRNYAPADTAGTVVAYSGPNPADASVCSSTILRVYLWRKNAQTGQYEQLLAQNGNTNRSPRGQLYTSASGEQLCQRPKIVLEDQFPAFLPGGDYRVGFRAERTVSGVVEFQRATLVTPLPQRTPSSILGDAHRTQEMGVQVGLIDELSAASPDLRAVTCRNEDLELALLRRFANSVWSGLGADGQIISGYLLARSAARDLYCNDDAFSSGWFATLFPNYGRDAATYFTQLVAQIGAQIGIDDELAARLAVRSINDGVAQQLSDCSPNREALAGFLFEGTPIAEGLEAALFSGCSEGIGGGVGAGDPQQIASAISSGSGLPGTFSACINAALEKELQDDECSDPRAQGAPQPDSDEMEQCLSHSDPDLQDWCFEQAIDRERRRQQQAGQSEESAEDPLDAVRNDPCSGSNRLACEFARDALNSPGQMSAQQIRNAREGTSILSRYWSVAVEGGVPIAETVHGISNGWLQVTIEGIKGIAGSLLMLPYSIALSEAPGAAEVALSAVHERQLREYCPFHRGHDKCKDLEQLQEQGGGNQRCIGEQLGQHAATYLTNGNPFGGSGERAMTMFDQMDACYCEFLGGPIFGQDCLSPDERKRQECIDPPPGNDDGPPRDCAFYLHSETLNPALMSSAMCHYVRPNPDCNTVIGPDGECICVDNLDSGDLTQRIGEEVCGSVYCDPLSSSPAANAIFDVRTGCCQEIPPRVPDVPGTGPTCRTRPLDDYFRTLDVNAIAPATILDVRPLADELTRDTGIRRDVQFYRDGYTSGLGAVTSRQLYPALWDTALDTHVSLDVETFRTASGNCATGRVQAFCTSAMLENTPIGEASLEALDPGQFGELHIPVARQLLDQCLPQDGTSARIGFAVDSCDGDGFGTALGDYTFTRDASRWVEVEDDILCPLDATGTRQVFELNVSPTTSAEFRIE